MTQSSLHKNTGSPNAQSTDQADLPRPDSEAKARGVILGKVVEALRLQYGWTQADLAEAAKTTQATISRLESGNLQRPDAFLFRELAFAFDLQPEQLHQKVEEATEKAREVAGQQGKTSEEWWSNLAIVALGALVLFVMLSLLKQKPRRSSGELPRQPGATGQRRAARVKRSSR